MKIKKASWLYVALAVVMLVSMFAGLTGADEEPCEPELVVDLIAGQNMVVGTVTVENDDEKVCVTYALDDDALEEGWLIYETHLYIGDCDFDGVLTRVNPRLGNPYNANPIPGQFPYGDDELDGVEEWTFCISFEDLGFGICNEVCIAAHAVVKRSVIGDAASATIYGVGTTTAATGATNDGNIYVINPFANESEIIFYNVWEAAGVSKGPWWYPNALAFDEDSGRLYFSLSRNSLYFFDVETEAVVNADPDNKFSYNNDVLGATFAEGYYWYILNQSKTLYKMAVDGDGFITGIEDSFTMDDAPEVLSQGDIVFKDGVIYGSSGTGAGGGANFKGFFSYDIAGDDFTVLEQDSSYRALQLAWGLDEDGEKVLVGHQVEDGTWYTIDLDPYGVNQIMADDVPFTTDRLEDLASGFTYGEIWESETAWGEGYRFNQRGNWGMWFKYKICEPDPCVPSGIFGILSTSASGNLAGSLYEIDVKNETHTLLYTNLDTYQHPYGNALALDEDNGRLYFTLSDSSSVAKELWFYDFAEENIVNAEAPAEFALGKNVCGAAFWDGYYWYIPDHTTSLMRISFHPNGTVDEFTEVGSLSPSPGGFGDIVYRDGIIYGSSTSRYFTYDISEDEYTTLFTGDHTNNAQGVGLQLAWGADGVLYGHSYVHRTWWDVDPATGEGTYLFTGDISFGDLADGFRCN